MGTTTTRGCAARLIYPQLACSAEILAEISTKVSSAQMLEVSLSREKRWSVSKGMRGQRSKT